MHTTPVLISIVSPVYLAEGVLKELVNRLHASLADMQCDYEIILVDDGSPDGSWECIMEICLEDQNVKAIKLSRNFGQHYAITAGLQACKGDWVVVMDCDLQDKPEEIPKLFQKTSEGFDIVYAQRKVRMDSFLKKTSSNMFYKIFGYLTDSQQDNSIANFGVYRKVVVQAILDMGDHIRYFPTMVQWVGFNSCKVPVDHGEREEGKSSYSWRKLLKLAFDNIIAFSDKPLKLTIRLGFVISFVSLFIGIFYAFKYFNGEIQVIGYTSLVLSIWFLSGLIIFILGIIGVYLGKTFEKVKDRPKFIVQHKLNCDG